MNSYYPTETRAISARVRRDLLEYLEWMGLNKNRAINMALTAYVRTCQRDQEFFDLCQSMAEERVINRSVIHYKQD